MQKGWCARIDRTSRKPAVMANDKNLGAVTLLWLVLHVPNQMDGYDYVQPKEE